jgi:hypothetical protein
MDGWVGDKVWVGGQTDEQEDGRVGVGGCVGVDVHGWLCGQLLARRRLRAP